MTRLAVEAPVAMKRAVIYLRVSTNAQADKDTDPEGYSLPAQRDACYRKAAALGAGVVDEYVDRGVGMLRVRADAARRVMLRSPQGLHARHGGAPSASHAPVPASTQPYQ